MVFGCSDRINFIVVAARNHALLLSCNNILTFHAMSRDMFTLELVKVSSYHQLFLWENWHKDPVFNERWCTYMCRVNRYTWNNFFFSEKILLRAFKQISIFHCSIFFSMQFLCRNIFYNNEGIIKNEHLKVSSCTVINLYSFKKKKKKMK